MFREDHSTDPVRLVAELVHRCERQIEPVLRIPKNQGRVESSFRFGGRAGAVQRGGYRGAYASELKLGVRTIQRKCKFLGLAPPRQVDYDK